MGLADATYDIDLIRLLYVGLTGMINDIGQWMGSLNIPVWSELFTTYADRNALYYFFYFALGATGLYHDSWKNGFKRHGRSYGWSSHFVRMDAHASRP